jgi:hypothetical protein
MGTGHVNISTSQQGGRHRNSRAGAQGGRGHHLLIAWGLPLGAWSHQHTTSLQHMMVWCTNNNTHRHTAACAPRAALARPPPPPSSPQAVTTSQQ